MESTLNFVSIIVIVFGILQIILFFKLWGMTNDIKDIKNKYLNINKNETIGTSNIISTEEYEVFPDKLKFQKGDIVLYKPENTKLIIVGYLSPNVFKCKTMDGLSKTYCFQEDYLVKCDLS